MWENNKFRFFFTGFDHLMTLQRELWTTSPISLTLTHCLCPIWHILRIDNSINYLKCYFSVRNLITFPKVTQNVQKEKHIEPVTDQIDLISIQMDFRATIVSQMKENGSFREILKLSNYKRHVCVYSYGAVVIELIWDLHIVTRAVCLSTTFAQVPVETSTCWSLEQWKSEVQEWSYMGHRRKSDSEGVLTETRDLHLDLRPMIYDRHVILFDITSFSLKASILPAHWNIF